MALLLAGMGAGRSQSYLAAAGPVTISSEGTILVAEPYAEIGFIHPTDITNAGDGRLFITSREGMIHIVGADGQLNETPFLDIEDRISWVDSEGGLLGVAFHPAYNENRYFFVHYTNLNGDSLISRFRTDENNANQANSASERHILLVEQPSNVHKGGDISFGPDGYLYASLGDGGPWGDPDHNAQNGQLLLGSVIRIDVDNGLPYTIPADNPFVDDVHFRDELWAKGLRNPWRFSFDRLTGDMFIGDVGHAEWEEVNFEAAGSGGGRNYGWRCYEGRTPFEPHDCSPETSLTLPVHVYGHSEGCAIIGGFVYRGSLEPAMYGHYIFADLCNQTVYSLKASETGQWQVRLVGREPIAWTSFGEGADGELYAVGLDNSYVYRLGTETIALPAALHLPVVQKGE